MVIHQYYPLRLNNKFTTCTFYINKNNRKKQNQSCTQQNIYKKVIHKNNNNNNITKSKSHLWLLLKIIKKLDKLLYFKLNSLILIHKFVIY